MKKILKTILICFITSSSNADVVGNTLDKASEKISEYTSGLIPGEGYTETSIDLRENSKPEVDGFRAVESLAVIMAGVMSAKENRTVRIQEILDAEN